MRSYQGYYTRSHQNSEVKRLWAGIVLGWVTSREVPVLHPFWSYFEKNNSLTRAGGRGQSKWKGPVQCQKTRRKGLRTEREGSEARESKA